MTESDQLALPSGWRSDGVAGGVDLRVVASGRKYVVAGAGILAALAVSRAMVQWNRPAVMPWLILSVILGAVTLWCAVGDEVWHVERNCLVHRTGVKRWGYSRRYQDASLDIRLRFSTTWNLPYYRLYVVINGNPSFLMERGEQELVQLAKFISHHTGWPVRTTTQDVGS
jgi:hypothetical protein